VAEESPLRLLQVMAGAAHGGAEMAFVDMCVALKEAGQTVEVVTRANDLRVPMLQQAGIRVHALSFGGALDLWTMRRMKKIIREFKPDIVQTWMSRAAQKTPRWTPSMGIPRYFVVSRLGGYYKITHFPQTDFFCAITPDIRRFLIDGGIAPDKVLHINNFAETENAAAPASRAAENTPDNAKLIVALGRLHPSKAYDTLMRALVDVPGVYLWIAGEGPQRAELEALRTALDLDDRVRFLGWRDDRAALLKAADLCVFPSRYEPFGTVFVQAWAQKIPLVTTASDGPRQYVQNGSDGLMVAVDDIPALAAAITRGLQDETLRRTMVDNGYGRYLKEFTKDQTIRQYLAFYRQMLVQRAVPLS
jgi:glycosyltransferase involved in cell wall biosynthesis